MYRWEAGPALVQTVDFFTPIVDDPYVYGQIAAANSVSDVYAMGGRPLTALAIAGFPDDAIDTQTIGAIFRGGFDKLREAGVALLGGHTVRDREIKFGYAVTGSIDPSRVLSNAGARPGDVLFLTKAIGTGIVGTAIKFGRLDETGAAEAVESMCQLNRAAADALRALPRGAVHACTDITGFGLIGHAAEMATASDVTVAIEASRVPLFHGVIDIAHQNRSAGMASNVEHFKPRTTMDPGVAAALVDLLYDPQTSGGLLISAAPDAAAAVGRALTSASVPHVRIGETRRAEPHARVVVTP